MERFVIVLEDDADLLEAMQESLKGKVPGIEFIFSLEVDDALTAIKRVGATAVAVFISDGRLPGFLAFEHLPLFWAAGISPARTILASGEGDLAKKAEARGIALFKRKPYEIEDLVILIRGLTGSPEPASPEARPASRQPPSTRTYGIRS